MSRILSLVSGPLLLLSLLLLLLLVLRLGSRPRLAPGLGAGEPEHLGRGLVQAPGPPQLRLEADVGGISATLSRHNPGIKQHEDRCVSFKTFDV